MPLSLSIVPTSLEINWNGFPRRIFEVTTCKTLIRLVRGERNRGEESSSQKMLGTV